jgi:hypothetical protein
MTRRSRTTRRAVTLLVATLVCGICLQPTAASPLGSDDAQAPPLSGIALRGEQVGPGYQAKVIPGGRLVKNQVSLDLCGFRYLSEDLRTARLQLSYSRPGSPLRLSNEVVRYRGDGAQIAFGELALAAATCPRRPVQSPVQGVGALTWRLTPIKDPRLLPSSVALVARVSRQYQGKRQAVEGILVYQVQGNVLSAVYTFGGTLAAQKRFGLNAAAKSAANLRRS